MRAAISLFGAILIAHPAAAQKPPVKIFSSWGSIEDPSARRCYALARPQGTQRTTAAASIIFWPAKGVRGQVHVRLSNPARAGSAILMRIDGGSYQLVGSGDNIWARDQRSDAAIVQAMRTGTIMTVESRSQSGRFFRDRYTLKGAATAIDAAAIACARR